MFDHDARIRDRLDALYNARATEVPSLSLGAEDRYAIFSDLHLGDGGGADNFERNEETMTTALRYYKDRGFAIILLGDIEEFWQFGLSEIRRCYDDTVYSRLREFPPGMIHRVVGNHDKDWIDDPDLKKGMGPIVGSPTEALMLSDHVFMVHGHQGDWFSDKEAASSRKWVRAFRLVEPIVRLFGYGNTAATKSQIPRNRERVYYQWAKEKKLIVISGHTHRAMFASRIFYEWLGEQIEVLKREWRGATDKTRREAIEKTIGEYKKERRTEKRRGRNVNPLDDGTPLPCYFNCGCGLYRKGITNLEIEMDRIRLIKWDSDRGASVEARREKLWPDEDLVAMKRAVGV